MFVCVYMCMDGAGGGCGGSCGWELVVVAAVGWICIRECWWWVTGESCDGNDKRERVIKKR